MQDKIIAAIAAYLEKETIVTGDYCDKVVQFGGVVNKGYFTHAGFCQEIATEIAAAIAPLVEGELCELKKLKIGDKVQIIALLDHSPAYGHEAPIGYGGYITAIDHADFELPYQVDMQHWVSRDEIKLI